MRFLRIQARRHPFATATQLWSELMNATGLKVSTQTVRNRLHSTGLTARKPCIRIPLSRDHRQHRYNWAQEHVNWPLTGSLSSSLTSQVTASTSQIVVPRSGESQGSVTMILKSVNMTDMEVGQLWFGVASAGREKLTCMSFRTEPLPVNATSMKFWMFMSNPTLVQFGENFILMDDNARPHPSRAVKRLERETIDRLDWPACSTDANPIEHVLNMLQTAVSHRNPQPHTLQELGIALREEWDNLLLCSVKTLIWSMGNRCRAIIRARGGHT